MEIMLLVFTVINWVVYHKIFRVYYFGNAGQSIFKEIFGCSLVAVLEVAIVMTVGGVVLPIVFVVGAIVLVIYTIYKICNGIKSGNDDVTEEEPEQRAMENNEDVYEQKLSKGSNRLAQEPLQGVKQSDNQEKRVCSSCGKVISYENKFCNFCGASISVKNEQTSSGKVICKSCGKEILSSAKFCNFCGKIL